VAGQCPSDITWAIAEAASRGFDVFELQFVGAGDFDRVLLRSRSTTLQLLGFELRLTQYGRLLQVCQSALASSICLGKSAGSLSCSQHHTGRSVRARGECRPSE
jgi:hypothetical protein